MTYPLTRMLVTCVAVALLGACASGGRTAANTGPVQMSDAERARVAAHILARTDSVRRPHTEADAHFMSGMIPHHAQAVVMAKLVPTRSTNTVLQALSKRMLASQASEIAFMQQWLRGRGLPVPDSNATHMRMRMGGMEHDMLMPGMLTDEELRKLTAARGVEFDRLFLTYMIKHHEGAISMVNELMASPGAAQDDEVYMFSSDVFADQTAEIDRMEKMLAALPPPGGGAL